MIVCIVGPAIWLGFRWPPLGLLPIGVYSVAAGLLSTSAFFALELNSRVREGLSIDRVMFWMSAVIFILLFFFGTMFGRWIGRRRKAFSLTSISARIADKLVATHDLSRGTGTREDRVKNVTEVLTASSHIIILIG